MLPWSLGGGGESECFNIRLIHTALDGPNTTACLSPQLCSCTVLHSMRVALLPHGMQEWNPRVICCRTRDFRPRDGACRGFARPRRMPPLAPTPGAHRTPGLPALSSSRTSSHATLYLRAIFPADSCRASFTTKFWRLHLFEKKLSLVRVAESCFL